MGRSNELLEICWRYFKLAQLATSKNYATDWVEGTKKTGLSSTSRERQWRSVGRILDKSILSIAYKWLFLC